MIAPRELPFFEFTNEDNCIATDEEWANRDTIYLSGTLAGTVRFAELLLNAGWQENTQLEIDLECEAGFRGVAPGSSEMKLVLPGSFPWPYNASEIPQG